MSTWPLVALLLGVASSAHCVGMCGPIALAVPAGGRSLAARWGSTFLLNGGRMVTYALLGAAFGTMGWGIRLAGLQQGLSVLAGVLMLAAVAVPGLLERWSPTGKLAMGIGRIRSVLARNLKRTAPEALFFTGALNGLLPCGMVYAALIAAAATGGAWEGTLFMMLFGLGTWPALFALRLLGMAVGPLLRDRLRGFAKGAMLVTGLLLVLRGAGLGIPYVSPAPPAVGAQASACP